MDERDCQYKHQEFRMQLKRFGQWRQVSRELLCFLGSRCMRPLNRCFEMTASAIDENDRLMEDVLLSTWTPYCITVHVLHLLHLKWRPAPLFQIAFLIRPEGFKWTSTRVSHVIVNDVSGQRRRDGCNGPSEKVTSSPP